MLQLTFKQRLFFLLLTGCLILLVSQRMPARSDRPLDFVPATSNPTAMTTTQPASLTCLDQEEIRKILGKDYQITYHQFSADVGQLSCTYQASESVDGYQPRITYLVVTTNAPQEWQVAKDAVTNKSGLRTFENQQLFAYVSPVVEVRQVTVHQLLNDRYVRVAYSPIEEDTTQMVEKAKHLTEVVASAVQK